MKIISSYLKKIRPWLIAAFILSGFFYSACDSFHDRTFYSADIHHFGFDSFPSIAKYAFYIDNYSGVIYNEDSLPYLTKIDSVYPTILTVTSNGDYFINDTIPWGAGQCIDFSKGPIYFTNTAQEGKHRKRYQIFVNVHQANPHAMQMYRISESFPEHDNTIQKTIAVENGYKTFFAPESDKMISYFSTTGEKWTAEPDAVGLSGNILVRTLSSLQTTYFVLSDDGKMFRSSDLTQWHLVENGAIKPLVLFGKLSGRKHLSTEALCAAVYDEDGLLRFATYRESDGWELGESVPEGFPVSDYAITAGQTATDVPFLSIATGLDLQGRYAQGFWSTMDGLYWARICSSLDGISPCKGAALFYYDNQLFFFGGNTGDRSLYISKDHGIRFEEAPSNYQFNAISDGLSYHQVLTDDVYIRIFGGKYGSNSSNHVWEGYLNRILFEKK